MRSGGVVKFSKSINNEQSLTAYGRAPFTQGSLFYLLTFTQGSLFYLLTFTQGCLFYLLTFTQGSREKA